MFIYKKREQYKNKAFCVLGQKHTVKQTAKNNLREGIDYNGEGGRIKTI